MIHPEQRKLEDIVFALLFAADEPVSIRKMISVIEDTTADEVKAALDDWEKRLDEEQWSIKLERIAGGYQLATRTDFAPFIGRFYVGKKKYRLSRAAMETLAIIAYKQPITRAEVDSVRGVGSGGVVTNLMERNLIKIVGKAKVLGAPFLYGTTQDFLEYLGFNSIKDLPSPEELEAMLARDAAPAAAPAVDGEPGDTTELEIEPIDAGSAIEPDESILDAATDAMSALETVVAEVRANVNPGAPESSESGETDAGESEVNEPSNEDTGEQSDGDDDSESAGAASLGPEDLHEPVNRSTSPEKKTAPLADSETVTALTTDHDQD